MFDYDVEELGRIADAHEAEVDDEFRRDLADLTEEMSNGEWPILVRSRDPHGTRAIPLTLAIVEELRGLLCTNDARWSSLRAQGNDFSKVALPTIAAYIAGTYHVTIGLATGGVALIGLAIVKMGVSAFCHLSAPKETIPLLESKSGEGV